jgi:hypothetical protein
LASFPRWSKDGALHTHTHTPIHTHTERENERERAKEIRVELASGAAYREVQ